MHPSLPFPIFTLFLRRLKEVVSAHPVPRHQKPPGGTLYFSIRSEIGGSHVLGGFSSSGASICDCIVLSRAFDLNGPGSKLYPPPKSLLFSSSHESFFTASQSTPSLSSLSCQSCWGFSASCFLPASIISLSFCFSALNHSKAL